MLPQQLEKLKVLINTSPILSSEERVEWLALLDLMNDKQLLELENILVAGSRPKSTAGTQTIRQVIEKARQSGAVSSPGSELLPTLSGVPSSAVVASSGFSGQNSSGISRLEKSAQEGIFSVNKAFSVNSSNVKQMPNLSHIVNLPSLEHSAFIGQTPVAAPAPKPPVLMVKDSPLGPVLEKKRNSFKDKLKSIFSEKELPAGNQSSELDLPAGDFFEKNIKRETDKPLLAQTEISRQNNAAEAETNSAKTLVLPGVRTIFVSSEAPIIEPFSKTFSKSYTPEPSVAPAGSSVKKNGDSPVIPAPQKNYGQTLPPIDNQKLPSMPTGVLADKIKNLSPVPSQNGVAQFAALAEEETKAKNNMFASIQKHRQDSNNNQAQNGSTAVNLQNLDDLIALSPEIFETENLGPITDSIKKLIRKYSYHDVIFKVEKSPAYKSYIQTGLELLSKQINFENLGANQSKLAYLTRRQFENITDLLRQIQAG